MAKKNAGKAKDKGKKRKRQVKKDGPKRSSSAFMFFSQDRRKSLKEEQPTLKITEASVLIGAEWKKLTDAEKEPYAKLAKEDKERYEREKESYESTQGPKPKAKKAKDSEEEESKEDEDDDEDDDDD
ncbi:hypothetical protein SteCoe_552 [Stentor coeruleus]|uniref:HMG box domain-containing protein n=1 Tax=Stentor coeruleus TaxID=5963 RepID=A0A1R2D3Z5_9CILI|nr:hypothetical protein SteCoe_552 [Stentor coeruleus]